MNKLEESFVESSVVCPECGGKLILRCVIERPGKNNGDDVLASCTQCDLDWEWYRDYDGKSHDIHRYFHG